MAVIFFFMPPLPPRGHKGMVLKFTIPYVTKFVDYKKKKMWYDCHVDNSPQETKMTQKLTTIGHRTDFNNQQNPYRIFSHKEAPKRQCKTFKREIERPNLCTKNGRKTNM